MFSLSVHGLRLLVRYLFKSSAYIVISLPTLSSFCCSLYNKDGNGNVRIQNPINGMLFEVAREALSSLPETSSGFEDLPPLKTKKLLSGTNWTKRSYLLKPIFCIRL